MTALALQLPSSPRLSWPRVGALSGTLSLHACLLLLLLTPPVAYQLMKPEERTVVIDLIDPPPKPVEIVEPVLPQPKHKDPPPRPVHHETVAPVNPPVETTTRTSMSYTATPADSGPADIGPAREIPPTALAYGAAARHVDYPTDALRRREHGTVILRVLVGADGHPQVVEIERSSGSPRLDKAARDAVLRWSFQPGTSNGVAQAAWAKVPIAFDLTTL